MEALKPQTAEHRRVSSKRWKRWGPYLSERAWGTVREDYSAYGNAWDYFPHDHARSRTYRWNEDGFLGLDNISLFDRSAILPTGGHIDQSDGTAWMGFFSLNMMRIALELARKNPVYQDMATKFFEHFLSIANAMGWGFAGHGLWDEGDGFFYDYLHLHDDKPHS